MDNLILLNTAVEIIDKKPFNKPFYLSNAIYKAAKKVYGPLIVNTFYYDRDFMNDFYELSEKKDYCLCSDYEDDETFPIGIEIRVKKIKR